MRDFFLPNTIGFQSFNLIGFNGFTFLRIDVLHLFAFVLRQMKFKKEHH